MNDIIAKHHSVVSLIENCSAAGGFSTVVRKNCINACIDLFYSALILKSQETSKAARIILDDIIRSAFDCKMQLEQPTNL